MSIATFIILILIGLVAGITGGLFGVGGGIIMIPALVFFLGLSQHQAQGTNLATMLPPIGLLAAINYYKAGYVNWKYALVLSAAFLIGGYAGSKFSVNINEVYMRKTFAILLLFVALRILFYKN